MSSTIIAIAVVAVIFILRTSIKRVGSTAETVVNTSLEIVNQGANHLDKVVKVNILESTADIDMTITEHIQSRINRLTE